MAGLKSLVCCVLRAQHCCVAIWPSRAAAQLPAAPQVKTRHGRELSSYYARWIEVDLSRWKKTLISRVSAGFQPGRLKD